VAVAEIIGSAIGAMILIIVAYLLVGNVLWTAEVVSNAQKDLTHLSESRLRTDITITNVTLSGPAVNLTIKNTGNEVVTDFPHSDVLLYPIGDATGYQVYIYNATDTAAPGSWTKSILNDYVHPGELDPGETMYVNAYFTGSTPLHFDVGFCTNNGVYASQVV